MLSVEVQTFLANGFNGISADSRKVVPGGLFVAYPGEMQDGRDYIEQALLNGATGVLYEATAASPQKNIPDLDANIKHLAVKGLKQLAGAVGAAYYGKPTQRCRVIGVTGTNGKTTVTQWLAQCFSALDYQAGVLGTLGYGDAKALKPTQNTTPDAIVLQSMMAELVAAQNTIVAMEVSSHGLVQDRVRGVDFDVAVFTNLSRDHLDYHQTMAAYGAAKRRLLEWDGLQVAIINTDDSFGRVVAKSLMDTGRPLMTYGLQHGIGAQHVRGEAVTFNASGMQMQVVSEQATFTIQAQVVGEFNALNILAVVSTLLSQKVSVTDIQQAVRAIVPVAGRMQTIGGKGKPTVVIDYAHTPAALETVLKSLREHCEQTAQLWCVFGCGGNRDQGKRALMGRVAGEFADKVILTSDNPRDEAPMAIIQDIEDGMTGPYWVEITRENAIKTALESAAANDVVLIAGKGHENYQEIAGVKHAYSDLAIAEKTLKKARRRSKAS